MATINREYGSEKNILLDELIEKYNASYRVCDNCSDVCDDDHVIKTDILFRTYRFCSEWCCYDAEHNIRKHFRRLTREEQDRRIATNKLFRKKLLINC